MWSATAKLILAGFLIPAAVVFVLSYRHALRHWLRPASPIPTAAIAAHRQRLHAGSAVRHVHAVAIAAAFASVSIMGLIAIALVAIAIIGTVAN